LKDAEPQVRGRAAAALQQLGPRARTALPQLTNLLKDNDGWVRWKAVSAIADVGDRTVVPTLIDVLQDPDEQVWFGAARCLARLDPEAFTRNAIPVLTTFARTAKPAQREAFLESVGELETSAPIVPLLREMLRHEAARTRWAAVRGLIAMGEGAAPAVPDLATALTDSDAHVRAMAAFALGRIGQKAVTAGPGLVEALKDSSVDVRRRAAVALAQVEFDRKRALPVLLTALRDPDVLVRGSAASALAHFGPEAKEALPQLLDLFKETDVTWRYHNRAAVLRALDRIGPAAKAAVPVLMQAIKDFEPPVWNEGPPVLRRISPEAADILLRDLLADLRSPDADVRRKALIRLPYFDVKGETVPALMAGLKDQDPHAREEAAHSLGMLSNKVLSALPALRAALKDSEARVRRAVALAIEDIEGAADADSGKP
jgi:HEAT repeat protein